MAFAALPPEPPPSPSVVEAAPGWSKDAFELLEEVRRDLRASDASRRRRWFQRYLALQLRGAAEGPPTPGYYAAMLELRALLEPEAARDGAELPPPVPDGREFLRPLPRWAASTGPKSPVAVDKAAAVPKPSRGGKGGGKSGAKAESKAAKKAKGEGETTAPSEKKNPAKKLAAKKPSAPSGGGAGGGSGGGGRHKEAAAPSEPTKPKFAAIARDPSGAPRPPIPAVKKASASADPPAARQGKQAKAAGPKPSATPEALRRAAAQSGEKAKGPAKGTEAGPPKAAAASAPSAPPPFSPFHPFKDPKLIWAIGPRRGTPPKDQLLRRPARGSRRPARSAGYSSGRTRATDGRRTPRAFRLSYRP